MELWANRCTLCLAMNKFRRQRLRSRLSILVILALLWSQLVLATHAAASMGTVISAPADTSMAMADGCEQRSSVNEIACKAHCSQGDQSLDVARVLPISALAPTLPVTIGAIVVLQADRASGADLPPPVSWHRPTLHPASVLLI